MKPALRKKSKIPKRNKAIKKSRSSKNETSNPAKPPSKPIHPWRVCPYGEHWVRTHPLYVPPSRDYPEGHETIRHEHCARNPSGKDQLYPEEIQEIARWLFEKKRLVSAHLKRPASWIETIWDYKGVKRAKTKKDAEKIKKIFNDFYEELQKCKKD